MRELTFQKLIDRYIVWEINSRLENRAFWKPVLLSKSFFSGVWSRFPSILGDRLRDQYKFNSPTFKIRTFLISSGQGAPARRDGPATDFQVPISNRRGFEVYFFSFTGPCFEICTGRFSLTRTMSLSLTREGFGSRVPTRGLQESGAIPRGWSIMRNDVSFLTRPEAC